jgi:hypothetical protein
MFPVVLMKAEWLMMQLLRPRRTRLDGGAAAHDEVPAAAAKALLLTMDCCCRIAQTFFARKNMN